MPTDLYPDYPMGTLHPESEAVLRELQAASAKPLSALSPREARACPLPEAWLGSVDPGVRIGNQVIPGRKGPIPIRTYSAGSASAQPLLVFFHGGGFVLGTLDEFDAFCAGLAGKGACTVVSVDYRLAPEHRFPAAFEDAWAAILWIAAHGEELGGDPERIAVAGDSAGGNLAAGLCLQARDQGFPRISLQVLLCPWVDLSDSAEAAPSFRAFGQGLWLSAANLRWYRDHYVETPAQADHPLASPLRAESLVGLPPALVLTAEFDVLAAQGRAYAHRLEEAGVPVTFRQHPGMLHDFLVMPGKFSEARTAFGQIAEAIHASFHAPGTRKSPETGQCLALARG